MAPQPELFSSSKAAPLYLLVLVILFYLLLLVTIAKLGKFWSTYTEGGQLI
jgi:hypothetical protein